MTMDFDPAELGLVDDGSTSEVMIYHVKQGLMDEIVEIFQEVFAEYKPEGFKIIFSAVDVANNRLIWVHRYAPDFDLKNRFYLGKYPKLTHCLWAGTRFDALEATTEELQPS
jgi:predicted secreted protein